MEVAEKIERTTRPTEPLAYAPQNGPHQPPPSLFEDLVISGPTARNKISNKGNWRGDGFAVAPEVLEQLAHKSKEIVSQYKLLFGTVDSIVSAEEPGNDYASVEHVKKLRSSGEALLNALQERIRCFRDLGDKFLAALDMYLTHENDAEATVGREKGKFE